MSASKIPSLNLPKASSKSTIQVSIIDTTCNITAPANYLIQPTIPGHEWLNLPTYAFHLTHVPSNRQLLFDLGSRTDWENNCPPVSDVIAAHVPALKVDRDVVDILHDGGVEMKDIEALILSHWHFDHCGDLAILPKSLELLVGPDFKKSFLPGWPANEKSPFHEAYFEGRKVTEVPFDAKVKIGGFEAFDYFGDGSLYILNVPGHATGHISALVRTTEDTFILLGGDVCHFGGSYRPTSYVPLPDTLPADTPLDARLPTPCPCSLFTPSHPDQANSRTKPFYIVSVGAASWYDNPPVAEESILSLEEFDAQPNVLVLIAHDPTYLKICNFFPKGNINEWKKKGWKEAIHWGFLGEMPYEGRGEPDRLVDGLYKGGKKIKDILA